METTTGKRIILGVTGGIAAYKAVELLRILRKRNHQLQVIMTRNAVRFVGPLTFQALSGKPVIVEMFGAEGDSQLGHVELAERSDLLAVVPATANIVGKFAGGIADDFLSTLYLASALPLVIVPAMNPQMYASDAVQQNIQTLKKRGHILVGPERGDTACGVTGIGRMSSPSVIADHIHTVLGREGDLQNRRVLITAGPTRESIDPVRFISNHSSGLMGYSLAAAAVERGASVTLISGPGTCIPHAKVQVVPVVTASDMLNAVKEHIESADMLFMAAAVADWTPSEQYSRKWKKGGSECSLQLKATEDILAVVGENKRENQIFVGFAAESENLVSNAMEKRHRKQLDYVVANEIMRKDTGFMSQTNAGILIDASDRRYDLPLQSKRCMADRILDLVMESIEPRDTAETP
jgi:phosphopantothenoylcysteine decarboxylase / phosphopantothenate---cysteine ligase